MDILPCFMWFSLIYVFGIIGWTGIAGDGVLKERAECAFPEPCYDWVKLQECDMGSIPQTSPSIIISECTTNQNNPWSRAFRYFAYQFDLIQEVGDGAVEPGGVVAVSRCTKKTGGIVNRTDAVAVIRSPAFNPGACLPIRVAFWFRLSHQPTFSDQPEQEYNLKVFVEDRGQPFPNEMIWGKETDYTGVVPTEWHYAEALFGRNAGEQFTVNFFAYHNDDCQTNLKTIAVDNIVIEQAVSSSVCTTTTPSTTTSSTTPTVPTPTPTTTESTTTPTVSTTDATTAESTSTTSTTDSPPSTGSTSETTTVSTTSSGDSTTSETITPTSTTSTLSPDTPESSTLSSTTLSDSTTSETATSTDSSTSAASTTESSTESTTTDETTPATNTPSSATSTDFSTSTESSTSSSTESTTTDDTTIDTSPPSSVTSTDSTTSETNTPSTESTTGSSTESTTSDSTTSETPSSPNSTISTASTVTEATTINSTTLSSNATSGSSDTTASTDSTTTGTTTTITTPPPDVCELQCGYGQCVSQGTTSLCECDEGFVQSHSTAPCRCPATFYYNGSWCLEASLTLGITYKFQREFSTDLSIHTSDLYKEWSTEIASQIQNQIRQNLTAELSARHVYVHVLSFRSGSVIADVLITAALYDINRELDIKNVIETSARNIQFTLAGSELVLENNVTFGYFNRCVNIEETSVCAANATCLFTSQTGKAVCECSDGYELNSDGRSCRVAAATPDVPRPTATPDGGTSALYIALYTIAGVAGAVVIVFTGIFVTRRYRAKNARPLPPPPPVYQARSHRTNAANVTRQTRQEAIYASIGDYDAVHPRPDYQYAGAVRTPSIRSTTSSIPDYDMEDFSHRRSSGYAGSQRSFSSFHPSEQSYELYGVLPLRKNK